MSSEDEPNSSSSGTSTPGDDEANDRATTPEDVVVRPDIRFYSDEENSREQDREQLSSKEELNLIVDKITPYLSTEGSVPALLERLTTLGAQTFADLKFLEWEKDLVGLVSPIQCRRMKEKILTGNVSGCSELAKKLVDTYEHALKDDHCVRGFESLSKQIERHIQYIHRAKEDDEGTPKRKRRKDLFIVSPKHKYGIADEFFEPITLPASETPESQEEKRTWLQEEFKRTPINLTKVQQAMDETYCSQRSSIIANKFSVESVLKEFPFLGKYTMLQRHFFKLLTISEDRSLERLAALLPKMIEFLKMEANKVRPSKTGEQPQEQEELIELIKGLEIVPTPTIPQVFIVAVQCISILVRSKTHKIFQRFPEGTSYDSAQASPNLEPHPIVAVIGDEPLVQMPTCYIFVDKVGLYQEKLTPVQGLLAIFMAHYVFSIHYVPAVSGIMEFIQRDIFHIVGEGSQTDRPKGKRNPPPMNGGYDGMMKKFNSFKARWAKK